MDEAIRNLGPVVGVLLIGLYGWFDVWRMHRKRHSSEKRSPDPAE